MATIPDVSAVGNAVPRPAGGVASYAPSMGRGLQAANEGFQGAGAALQEAAATIAATNERQDTMVAQAADNAYFGKLQLLQLDQKTGFANVKEGGAVGQQFLDAYMGKARDAATEIRGQLTSPVQQRLFDQRAQINELRFRGALLQHQAQETDRFNNSTENQTLDLIRHDMFQNIGNADAVSASLSKMNWILDQKGARMGWSPEQIAATKVGYLSSVYKDAVSMMVERDPVGTLPALDKRLGVGAPPALTGNAAIDNLEPSALVEYHRRAQSEVDQIRNKATAEEKARVSKAESETDKLQVMFETGAKVAPEYAAQMRALTIGTPSEVRANLLIEGSYVSASFGSRTQPDQEEWVRQMKLKAVTSGTSPIEQAVLSRAETIHANQQRAYKENPWAAAAAYGRVQTPAEARINSPDQVPQLIASRADLQGVVEQYAGAKVSPLQPGEATALTEQLAKMPVPQQAEALGAIGAQLDVEHTAVVADQIDKGNRPLALMLRLNDRTTAGRTVAEMVGKGAQALKDKTVKRDDQALSGWKAEIATKVRGILGSEKDEQAVIDAAYYVRAAMDLEGDTPAGFVKDASIERAIRLVIGQPMERSGVKTILPRGMSQDDFDERLRLDPVLSQIPETVYVRGVAVPGEQMRYRLPTMGMRRDSAGGYIPASNNAPVTTDPSGLVPLRLRVQ